jgi:hypothetical protein
VDRHDHSEAPKLLVAVTQQIADGHDPAWTVSKRFDFVEIGPAGAYGVRSPHGMQAVGAARYLDYEPIEDVERGVASHLRKEPWLRTGVDKIAVDWAVTHGMPEQLTAIREQVTERVGRTRRLVKQRLTLEINHWDARHAELLEADAAGRQLKVSPETAFRRARDLEGRLERRLAELARDEDLTARSPVVAGGALVIPQGLLDKLLGRMTDPAQTAKDTALTERRAVHAVLAAERGLGRFPQEMPHSNPGYDVRSRAADDRIVLIEVKGRTLGTAAFWVTRTEALTGKNSGADFRLAMVMVHPDDPERDEVRYIVDPFREVDFGDFSATGVIGDWDREWVRGGGPV